MPESPAPFVVRIELKNAGELYGVHMSSPYSLLASAKAWAAMKLSELYQRDHILVRDAVVELIEMIEDLEGEGPFVRSMLYEGESIKVVISAQQLSAVPTP